MGLNMYLEARRYISPIDKETEPVRRAIEAAIGCEPATDKPGGEPELMEVCAVVMRVGHWRKFWPLHNWFVNNVQEGHDDCRPAFVSAERLEELEEQLDQVDDDLHVAEKLYIKKIGALLGFSESEIDEILAAL